MQRERRQQRTGILGDPLVPAAMLELMRDLRHGRRAARRIAGQAARDEIVELRRDLGARPRTRRGVDELRAAPVGEALERQRAGDQLEQHDADRPDIDARRDQAPGQLLGRHVGRRADAAAGRDRELGPELLGDAEVDDLGDVAGEHDVRRLEIAVDHPAVVDGLHAATDRGDERSRGGLVEGADPVQPRGEALAGDMLHHQKTAVADVVDADIEDAHDILVDDRPGLDGLGHECRAGDGIVDEVRAQELDRDGLAEEAVPSRIHLARAAAPDQRTQLVISDDATLQ
jgi:hypothetical protein